jgi:hypothetical protein
MTGRRVYPDQEGFLSLAEGEYGQDKNGNWFARPPGGLTGNLAGHKVEEHADGTITVMPSIKIKHPSKTWHGYLERGEWKES